MKNRSCIKGFATLLLLALCCSCIPQEGPQGTGDVSLVFSAASLTRAEVPGDGTAADGGGIARRTDDATLPDLWIFLVNNSTEAVAARYPGAAATDGELHPDFTALRDTVSFQGLEAGEYTVYAFANTEDLALAGSPDLSTLTTKTALDGLLFAALAGDAAISLGNSRLPLAATAPLTVTANHNGTANVELLRCLAKITVELINQTEETLSMPENSGDPGLSLTLHNINPNQGYVFAHDPDIPSGAYTPGTPPTSRSLAITENPSIVAKDTLKLTRFVFPSDTLRCGAYTVDVSFYLAADDATYSYAGLPILDYRARNLTFLKRNQHLRLQIRISRERRVSFNFRVEEWDEKTEYITFE